MAAPRRPSFVYCGVVAGSSGAPSAGAGTLAGCKVLSSSTARPSLVSASAASNSAWVRSGQTSCSSAKLSSPLPSVSTSAKLVGVWARAVLAVKPITARLKTILCIENSLVPRRRGRKKATPGAWGGLVKSPVVGRALLAGRGSRGGDEGVILFRRQLAICVSVGGREGFLGQVRPSDLGFGQAYAAIQVSIDSREVGGCPLGEGRGRQAEYDEGRNDDLLHGS